MRQVGYGLLFLTGLATLLQLLWLGPNLPDPVASHFGPNGLADSWMSRGSFLCMQFILQIGLAGLMLGIAFGSKWIPDSVLNMPNKDYWLHADRRAESLNKNASLLIFIAGLTGMFMSIVFQFVYAANVQNGGQLSSRLFPSLVGVYLLIVLCVVVFSMWSFRLPDIGKK